MATASSGLIYPARLHHLGLATDRPAAMIAFYRDAMQMIPHELADGHWLLEGRERKLVLVPGARGVLAWRAYAVDDADRLAALKGHLAGLGIATEEAAGPLFGREAFAVADPDGNRVVVGLAEDAAPEPDALPGRLQHAVVTSTDPDRLVDFHRDALGFLVSDFVRDANGAKTAVFLRTDREHHSFAAFRAAACGFDHLCCETRCWNDLRDWADHFADLGIALVWGPGRHGPGNNLFIMVKDPDGNNVELSAEIELVAPGRPPGEWPHEERTLNAWGGAWMRA